MRLGKGGLRWFGMSWRWLIIRPIIGVVVVFTVAGFLYPHVWPWFVVAALIIAGAQTLFLLGIWRRWGQRLCETGFRWRPINRWGTAVRAAEG